MSLVNKPGSIITLPFGGASIQDSGYVLMWDASNNYVKVHDGTAGTPVIGVNLTSTEDPANPGTYLTSGYIAVQVDGVAEVQVDASNSAFEQGDLVYVKGSGKIDKFTWDDLNETFSDTEVEAQFKKLTTIVGIALEAKAANAGGTAKVLLRPL